MPHPLVRLPSLDLVKGFVAVGRRMSVTEAAEDLCLTQSAISKQIRTLEDMLGAPLFVRGFRSLAFTEQGELLFRVADRSIQDIQNILELVCAPRRTPVTVTASTSFASLWLLPRLGDFQGEHPNVDVRFSATNAVLELGADADLAIRYCTEQQAPMGASRLFGETIAAAASPVLQAKSLASVDMLRAATLLEFDVQGRPWLHWSDWLAAQGWSTSAAKAVLHFNQYEQVVQAALDGRGILLGRMELLQPYFQSGQLERVPMPSQGPAKSSHAFWLIQAPAIQRHDVQCVADWIVSKARQVERAMTR